VPFEFIDKVFAVMALTSAAHVQVLTKRPERMAEYVPPPVDDAHIRPVAPTTAINLITGGSYAKFGTGPGRTGEMEYRGSGPLLDWLIVGGESGHGARPFDVAWARSIVRQCREAGVACFVKQLGARPFDSASEPLLEFETYTTWVNKARSWLGGVSGGGVRYKKPADVVCVDAKGRICSRGEGFMRARDEDAFR
jgi:hypothetical protein